MGSIVNQLEGQEAPADVRCPICGAGNAPMRYCRHVRWTFDQGDPIDFAKFALEMSPYVEARGHKLSEIPAMWWKERGDWVVDRVLTHFDASDGYVFGELVHMDLLARDIWKEFHPDSERAQISRYDP